MTSPRKHIMLSYQWGVQELVIKVYDRLKEHGINVWMDIRGGMCLPNKWQCMAEGVENSVALCCFLTPEYQASPNCLRELQRAAELNLLIIPCRLCADWKPSGSLGFLITGLLWLDFRDTEEVPFEISINKLIDHIQMHAYDDEPIYFPETRPYNRSQVTIQDVSFSSSNPQNAVDVSSHTTIISSRTTYENSKDETRERDENQCCVTKPLPLTTSTVDQMNCKYENSITHFMFKNVEKRNMRFVDALEEPGYLLMPIDGYQERPLMSLEKAIEPAKHLLGRNIDEMIHIAKERCQYPKDGLSTDESAAILLYTMEDAIPTDSLYYVLNNALRAEERRGLVPFFSYLKLVLTALWKLPSEKCVAWRGVNGNITDNFEVDKTIVWWGFSSCTISMNVLESSNYMNQSDVRTLFSIECMNGKIIRNHSYFKNENEILLLPAIQLQVLSKMSPAPNLHIIHLREIEGPFPLLKPPFTSVIPYVLSENNLCVRSTVDVLANEIPQGLIICARTRQSHSQSPCQTRRCTRATSARPVQKLSQMLTLIRTNATVNLSNKEICDDDLKILSEELKSNHRCISLSLSSNNITSDGIKSLTLVLRGSTNRTLKSLILSSNNITDESVQSISNMLKANKTLETLDLSTNSISDNGIRNLVEAIKLNTTLKKLCLNHNLISDTGVQILLQGLKRNGTLELINLCGNQISDDMKEKFTEQLSKGTHTLKTILL